MILFLFYFLLVFSSVLMISVSNPVTSVLFLIGVFFNTSIIFILMNVDFLGLLFLMIYVGAIAVLFLFIIMMLNVQKFDRDNLMYFTIGGTIVFFYFFQFFFLLFYQYITYLPSFFFFDLNFFDFIHNFFLDEYARYMIIKKIGIILYSDYFVFLFYASLILFVSMIGAIYLTNNKQGYSMRRQFHQLSRNNYIFNIFSC